MRAFLRQVTHALETGQDVQLVTILASSGSTPRRAGAMLAVFPDGRTAGTVGGGNVEFEATNLAKALLPQGKNALRQFRFIQGDDASLGMVCGGGVTLHFHHLSAGDPQTQAVFRALLDATQGAADTWLIRRLEGERVTALGLADRTGFQYLEDAPVELLQAKAVCRDGWSAVQIVRAGKVYIFGGGHVSQALVPVIAGVGFRPVVYDDRPEFTSPTLFPQAEATFCGSFLDISGHFTVTPDDYVVIMTRGHQADYEVLTQTLRSGAKYLGCIGSKKKLALCRDRLLAAGFTPEEYARLHAPIGLAIGAETPEEIAISVAAELIAVRAGM